MLDDHPILSKIIDPLKTHPAIKKAAFSGGLLYHTKNHPGATTLPCPTSGYSQLYHTKNHPGATT